MTLRKIDKDMIDPSFKQEIDDEISNQINVLTENVNGHKSKIASTTTLGHVMVDGTTITIDVNGKIKSSGGAIPDASTTVKGITQLNDSITSTSTSQAATASAVKALNDLKADKVLEGSIQPSSMNGFDTNAMRCYKDSFGIVHVEGFIAPSGGVGSSGVQMCSLPVGYRPSATKYVSGITVNSSGQGVGTYVVQMNIATNGAMRINSSLTSTVYGITTDFSFTTN